MPQPVHLYTGMSICELEGRELLVLQLERERLPALGLGASSLPHAPHRCFLKISPSSLPAGDLRLALHGSRWISQT